MTDQSSKLPSGVTEVHNGSIHKIQYPEFMICEHSFNFTRHQSQRQKPRTMVKTSYPCLSQPMCKVVS